MPNQAKEFMVKPPAISPGGLEILSSGEPIYRIKKQLNRLQVPNILGLREQRPRPMWSFEDVRKSMKLLGIKYGDTDIAEESCEDEQKQVEAKQADIEYEKQVDREVDAHFGRKTHGI